MKNKDNNVKNDILVVGTDLFADSENFLNELTDSEMVQVEVAASASTISLLLCDELPI